MMTDSGPGPAPVAPENPEPSPSPAPAAARGPTLWHRLKSLLALRTVSLRDDLEVALGDQSSPETSDFSQSERTILQNVLQLGEKRVDDVMVPRADIEAVEVHDTLGTLVARFRSSGHSRLPVHDGELDNIVGFVHVKDALRRITDLAEIKADALANGNGNGHSQPVKLVTSALRQRLERLDIIRTVLFVPPSMPVGDLLQSMQTARVHMAIVVDEYGGTDGLVTIEDLLEAVVGEIEDEHDELDDALVRKVDGNTYIASARAELDEVKEAIGPDFDPGHHAEDVETLGGLLFELVGRVPVKGEIISKLKGFDFEVLQSDSRQVKKVMVKRVSRPARARKAPGGEEKAAAE